MKKGVVFTIDALLAFGIFLSSLFLFSQFFVDTSFEGIAKTNIYSQSEKFLSTYEQENSKFYNIYSNYMSNNSNDEALSEILELFTVVIPNYTSSTASYPVNLRFYIFNNSQMQIIANSSENEFEQNIVLRRYLVYKNIIEYSNLGAVSEFSVESGLPNSTLSANATVENTDPGDWTDVLVQASVFGMNWTVTPSNYSTNLNAGESNEFEFQIQVPEYATADTYTFKINLTYNYGGYNEEYYDTSFYVVQYGLVEMEVGLK